MQAPAHIVARADARIAAKQAKDYARADALRDEILAAGREVKDVAAGYELMVIG